MKKRLLTPDPKVCVVLTSRCLRMQLFQAHQKKCKNLCEAGSSPGFATKPQVRQVLSGVGLCNKSFGYKSQEKNICNGSGQ